MAVETSRKKQAKILRSFRKIHRVTGAVLFFFFVIISVSGILLGWKSNSKGLILPDSKHGISTDLKEWIPIDNLHQKACFILHDSIDANLSLELNRIDIRKNKGLVKFVFDHHYWEIQLDGKTGDLLQIASRNSDLIEDIHDGSVLDHWFETSQKQLKLFYTSLMGVTLLLFTVTGFWLWYGPKRMKRSRS